MSRPLIVSIPHKFGRQEARRLTLVSLAYGQSSVFS
jgi:hypothetical protein